MFGKLFDLVLGCSHSHLSFPRSAHGNSNVMALGTGIYVVCLDCGKQFAYDWEQMAVIRSQRDSHHRSQAIMKSQAV